MATHILNYLDQGLAAESPRRGRILRGLGITAVALAYVLYQLAVTLPAGAPGSGGAVPEALWGGLAAAAATAVGALPVFFLRRVSARLEDVMLGFSAGVMLAASVFSLLIPGIEAGTTLLGGKTAAALLAVFGLGLGVALMLAIEKILPHQHGDGEVAGDGVGFRRVWLLVLAILIHNFPEGLAIGTAFSGSEAGGGIPVTLAIAIQDMPEGLVVALALLTLGYRRRTAWLIAAASGLAEPLGAVAGAGLLAAVPALYPVGLTLAGGAMIFVVSHEIIPETHRRGHETAATLGLMVGFMVMMVLDTTLV